MNLAFRGPFYLTRCEMQVAPVINDVLLASRSDEQMKEKATSQNAKGEREVWNCRSQKSEPLVD